MKTLTLFALLFLTSFAGAQQPAAQGRTASPETTPTPSKSGEAAAEEKKDVNLAFPRTSIFEILSFYEKLTGKRIIRGPNLTGPEIQLMISEPVSRQEAIKLIESSMLINGYSIVPVDETTIKVLSTGQLPQTPRSEGLPLYNNVNELPTSSDPQGDRLVSFYKPLFFISPEEATTVLQSVLILPQPPTPVPNTNAIIITDKTPLIRKALEILSFIDVEPAKVETRFVDLQRANAERVVEILEELLGKDDATKTGAATTTQAAPPTPDGAPPITTTLGSGARYENRLIGGKAKFIADKRTNRILVIARAGDDYRYVMNLIAELDAPGTFDQPYVRPLNYVSASDIFPTLSEMLASAEAEKGGGTSAQPQATPSNPLVNNTSGQRGGTGTSTTGGLNRPDRLSAENRQTAPLSVRLGEIRLIADPGSNSIIVFGPPESKQRTKQLLDLLDTRQKQVYLAVVIGQLRLSNDMDYSVSYLLRNKALGGGSDPSSIAASILSPSLLPVNSSTAAAATTAGTAGTAANTVLPAASKLIGPGSLTPALTALSGLTVYGAIADTVDVYARFLEATNRFRILQRPLLYTKNNEKATILIGQKVPVPVSTLTQATGGAINNAAVASNIQYQDVALKLEVIPLINSDREVNLVIAQTNDSIVGRETISGNTVPVIGTQELTTSVRVPNGSTVVLGGLVTDEKTNIQEGMPYLSRIPVLGTLLGGRTNNIKTKNELVILIQPVVAESNAEMLKASAYEGDRTVLGMDAQAMAAPLAEQANPPPPGKPASPPQRKKKKKRGPASPDEKTSVQEKKKSFLFF